MCVVRNSVPPPCFVLWCPLGPLPLPAWPPMASYGLLWPAMASYGFLWPPMYWTPLGHLWLAAWLPMAWSPLGHIWLGHRLDSFGLDTAWTSMAWIPLGQLWLEHLSLGQPLLGHRLDTYGLDTYGLDTYGLTYHTVWGPCDGVVLNATRPDLRPKVGSPHRCLDSLIL